METNQTTCAAAGAKGGKIGGKVRCKKGFAVSGKRAQALARATRRRNAKARLAHKRTVTP